MDAFSGHFTIKKCRKKHLVPRTQKRPIPKKWYEKALKSDAYFFRVLQEKTSIFFTINYWRRNSDLVYKQFST